MGVDAGDGDVPGGDVAGDGDGRSGGWRCASGGDIGDGPRGGGWRGSGGDGQPLGRGRGGLRWRGGVRGRAAQPEEAERRATEAKARLWQAYQRYEAGLAPELVSVRLIEGEPAVWLGDVWLVRVTEADRRANRSTGLGLARQWADNLRRVIAEYLRINAG